MIDKYETFMQQLGFISALVLAVGAIYGAGPFPFIEQGVRLGHVTPDGIVSMPSFRMAYFNPEDTAGILIEMVQPLSQNQH